ncbi:MAG TPA: hypothetical protein VGC62_25110 [Pseudomonas sp.]|uniref:hypothetical protein n=1 Tax=Pseudomonas sp. TaxID=306 RepID=UPI002ED9EDAC
MNAPLTPSYTNEVSAEYLRTLNKSVFTEEQLAGFSEETLAIFRKQQAYTAAHPPIGIFRLATEGSQTQRGGVVKKTQSFLTFTLDNGQEVNAAHKGDYVMYSDGTTAQIVTGAGQSNSDYALVGSRLSNGDEIINTLQGCGLWVERNGVPMADDFLPPVDS